MIQNAHARRRSLIVALLTTLLGAYLLLLANGVRIAILERTQGWDITPLPSHPVAYIIGYATTAIALQCISAWQLMLLTGQKGVPNFWWRYAAAVALCVGGGVVCAGVLLVLIQALLDAGLI